MHRCRKLAVMYTVAVQSASCRVLDGYACMSLPRAMQEAVEQRGLGLVCPAISFDTTVVLVTEAGLSPLELLRVHFGARGERLPPQWPDEPGVPAQPAGH